ncbi:MAG: cyclic nucleotide-binding domain-containing protein, partial [Deltaproteobacteria bacterium]|nr:cyclic nucleotide-binding domain-containing protein [Deltaproteobacteria bacterium]
MEKIIKIIYAIPVFRGLSEDSLNQVRKIAKDRFYDKGRIVFSEGDEGDGFYVVADGSVKIYKVSAEGKEHILH